MMNSDTCAASIIAAEEVIGKLTAKKAAVLKRVDEIATERAARSYDALAQDDAAAKKALATLSNESLGLDHQIESLDAALAEAATRLEKAQRAELECQNRENATRARSNFKRLGASGVQIAEHLLAASMLIDDAKRLTDDNHSLGYAHPNWQLFQVNLERAVSTWIMTLPLRRGYEHRFLSPRERTDIGRLFAEWSANGLRSIDQQFSNLSGNGVDKQQEADHANV
jgi:hypothetical protein